MNFRLSIIAWILILFSVSSQGMPAKEGKRVFRQPDGSLVELRLTGDEFYHEYVDSEGRIMVQDADGFFRPAGEEAAAMRRKAGIARRGRRNLITRGSEDGEAIGRQDGDKGVTGREEGQPTQVPHIGKVKIPIILVQYQDVKFRDLTAYTTFSRFFMDGSKSANSYFLNQSDGAFDPQFDVYGPLTLNSVRRVYGGNDYTGGDRGVGKMVAEACKRMRSLDFSEYDNDGDGECDVVIVLYAGDGEASSSAYNASEAIWPCQWDLETSDYGSSLILNDTKVNKFAVFNELNGTNLNKIDGVGTFCHEFSHCLGLPDFYDTQYGPHFGMGHWSIMDHGGYNDDGYTPIGYSAYEKEFMGWLEIPEAEPDTSYTLTPMNRTVNRSDMALRFTNPADPDEFYILENRQHLGWDRAMAATGMLITHFTYDGMSWNENCVNDFDLQRATLIPADNDLKLVPYSYFGMTLYDIVVEDEATDLWPIEGAFELTDTSVPAAGVNTGGFMSKPILDISRNDDLSISFRTGKFGEAGVKTAGIAAGEEEGRWLTLQGIPLAGRPEAAGIYILASEKGSRKIVIK